MSEMEERVARAMVDDRLNDAASRTVRMPEAKRNAVLDSYWQEMVPFAKAAIAVIDAALADKALMKTVHAKHLPYETGHLADVVTEMRQQGAPTIRVMRFDGELYATEGSHRLAAAHYLGEVPKLVVEIEEAQAIPDEHWTKVSETLPIYEFEHVLVLDLKAFEEKV